MPQEAKQKWTFDHLRKRELSRRIVPILVNQVEPPKQSDFTSNGSPLNEDQLKVFEAAEHKYRADLKRNMAHFQIQAIGRTHYEDLIDKCPPTAEQLAEAEKKSQPRPFWDQDKFGPALVHACLREPELSLEEVTILMKEWALGEAQELFSAALDVNISNPGSSPLPNAFGRMFG
ncbi:MAG: hypothetical protein ACR2M4_06410 [Actinomycetota bacterium]